MNAGLATVIFYTFPAVVAVLNIFVFHEKLTLRIVAALVLSMGGIVLISGAISPSGVTLDLLGILFGILGCCAFAAYSVLIQKTARVESSFTATFSISLVCLAGSLVFFSGELGALSRIGAYELVLASGLSILSTILPIILYIFSVGRIGATKAAIISIAEAPSSLLLAWVILGETIDAFQALGSALVIASILVVTLRASMRD